MDVSILLDGDFTISNLRKSEKLLSGDGADFSMPVTDKLNFYRQLICKFGVGIYVTQTYLANC